MYKKTIKIIGVLLFSGFSFYYTHEVNKVIRKKDPIMISLQNEKKKKYIDVIKPIIYNDEYILGINGCQIDIDESYSKMKEVRQFKEDLIVMKEVKIKEDLKDKYIISANKLNKNVSLIFIVDNNISNKLLSVLKENNVKGNFFANLDYLEKNTTTLKSISENNNIYYLGNNNKYDNEYMIYANNLISINSKNESSFCLLEEKDDKTLKLCSDYNMRTIKTDILKDHIFQNIKNTLSNGSIIAINSNNIDEINVSIKYILSKGYNIVSLHELLNEKSQCNK